MIEDILGERIKEYNPTNAIEQENALQELMHLYILASLSRTDFFSEAIFHGGTCLRIAYGMSRFSEDLDFLLKETNPDFKWQKYVDRVLKDGTDEGIYFQVQDRSKKDYPVKKVFFKTDSIGKVLLVELPYERDNRKLFRVKLEVDTNPPEGSAYETRYITFPTTAALTTQTLESGFGMKACALLCRGYTKGRDWYDFIWYTTKKAKPDLKLLKNALYQQGPWAGQDIEVTPSWFIENLQIKISELDWDSVREDVQRFLPMRELEGLELWSEDFFLYQLGILAEYMNEMT